MSRDRGTHGVWSPWIRNASKDRKIQWLSGKKVKIILRDQAEIHSTYYRIKNKNIQVYRINGVILDWQLSEDLKNPYDIVEYRYVIFE